MPVIGSSSRTGLIQYWRGLFDNYSWHKLWHWGGCCIWCWVGCLPTRHPVLQEKGFKEVFWMCLWQTFHHASYTLLPPPIKLFSKFAHLYICTFAHWLLWHKIAHTMYPFLPPPSSLLPLSHSVGSVSVVQRPQSCQQVSSRSLAPVTAGITSSMELGLAASPTPGTLLIHSHTSLVIKGAYSSL